MSHRLGITLAQQAVADTLDCPGLQQVFEIVRTATNQRPRRARCETVYGITSLPPRRADAACLLSQVRQHWFIENRSHWVRDVTYDEDRSQVRYGSIPQIMAALRNPAISLMRHHRRHQISQQPGAASPANPGRRSHSSAYPRELNDPECRRAVVDSLQATG
jgi:hypothetical protein